MSLTPSGLPTVQDEEKNMAMFAHLFILLWLVPIPIPFITLVGPGALYLMKKDTSPYIAYHALQAALFQIVYIVGFWIAFFVAYFALAIFTTITLGLGGICSFLPAPIFLSIPFALKAKNGEWAGYPLLTSIGLPSGVS